MVRSRENLIGAYAFLIGVILAVVLGLFQNTIKIGFMSNFAYALLVSLGIIIGYISVEDRDSNTFLLASLALVIVGGMGNSTLLFISNISPILSSLLNVLSALLVMFVPATIVAALKTVFAIAKI